MRGPHGRSYFAEVLADELRGDRQPLGGERGRQVRVGLPERLNGAV